MRPLTLLVSLSLLIACAHSANVAREVNLVLEVRDDNGAALSNVPILIDDTRVATTDPLGLARAIVQAGKSHRLRVRPVCPSAYREPESRSVSLAPASRETPNLTLRLTCVPKLRTLVVIVRAPGAEGLPVRVDGQTVASVGPEGSAHVLLQRPDASSLRLSLDTSSASRLTPQFPVREIEVTSRDEIVVFDQAFSLTPLPTVPLRRRPKSTTGLARHVPYAIGRSH